MSAVVYAIAAVASIAAYVLVTAASAWAFGRVLAARSKQVPLVRALDEEAPCGHPEHVSHTIVARLGWDAEGHGESCLSRTDGAA